MRALKRLIILAMACVFLCTQGIAISEADPTVPPLRHILDIDLAVFPNELVDAGEVTLTFTVTNDSEFAANNLYFESADGHHSESLGQLGPGDSQVYTRKYTVSAEELDSGKLAFTISHDDLISSGGESVTYEVEVPLSRSAPLADIEFTRQVSSGAVTADSTVVINYRVRNTGNVALENVRVEDVLGNFTGAAEYIEPGETVFFSQRISVDKDAVSKAGVTYTAPAAGDKSGEVRLSDYKITVVEPAISVGLTLDRQSAAYGDTVNGVVTIGASGSDITGIVVYDDVNNTILADSIEVKAGDSATLTFSWPVRSNTDFRVRVEGVDSTGSSISGTSGTAKLRLSGEFPVSALELKAAAQTPDINRPGKARISIAITNTGNTAARNVVLSEASLGEIRTFAFVPAGEPTVLSVLVNVEDDAEFKFSVSCVSHDGSTVTAEAAPVRIEISSDGADPVNENGDSDAQVYDIRDAATYYWMIGAGAVVLIVLIVLLIISHDRERRERKLRRELGLKRRRDTASQQRGAQNPQNDQ